MSVEDIFSDDPGGGKTFRGTQGVARDVTRLKQTQKELQSSEERFRSIFEHSPEGIIVSDIETGRFLFANPAARSTLGVREEELGRLSWTDIIHPDFIKSIDKGFPAFETDSRMEFDEAVCLRHGGDTFYADVHMEPVSIGENGYCLSFIKDLTPRVEAVTALRESEEKFKKFADEVSLDGIVIHHAGKIIEGSKPFAKMFGYEQEELVGLETMATIDPEFRDVVSQNVAEGRENLYEARGTRKDGTTFPIEIMPKNLSYKGLTVRAVAIRDITDRKKAEDILRDAEERYRTLFELAGDAIMIISAEGDREGIIINANQATADMHASTIDDIIGKHIDELCTPEAARFMQTQWEKMFTGEWIKTEISHIDRNGREFPVEISAGLISLSGQHYFLAIDRDISDRKAAERKRQQLEAQLRHSQKMEAVGTLSGGIAHDFNNILQAITGFVQLMQRRGGMDERQDHYLFQIGRATKRASELVSRLLTFSRRVEPKLSPVDLNDLVTQTVHLLRRTLPKMIDIRTDLDADLPFVFCDEGQIEQVLLNLGKNGGDAMGDAGVLEISTSESNLDEGFCQTHPGAKPGRYIRLSIKDTGQGMDDDVRKQIFDPFFTTKKTGRGTGLGLAMTYGIIKNHDGYIYCDSAPGQGARFDTYWPVFTNQRPADLPAELDEGNAPGGRETVLVVDDEESVLELIQQILNDRGYNVLVAPNGEEALEIYHEKGNEIDLLILDMWMPGMGGRICLQKLKEINPDIKVIIASGHSLSSVGIGSNEAQAYLSKPFDHQKFLWTVRRVLDN